MLYRMLILFKWCCRRELNSRPLPYQNSYLAHKPHKTLQGVDGLTYKKRNESKTPNQTGSIVQGERSLNYTAFEYPKNICSGGLELNEFKTLYAVEYDDLIKIGITGNFERRLIALQSCYRYPLIVHYTAQISSLFYMQVEKYAHAEMGKTCVFGEWFDVSPEQAITGIKSACDYSQFLLEGYNSQEDISIQKQRDAEEEYKNKKTNLSRQYLVAIPNMRKKVKKSLTPKETPND